MNNVFKKVKITHKLLLIVLGLMCTNQLNAINFYNKYITQPRYTHWCNKYSWRRIKKFPGYERVRNWTNSCWQGNCADHHKYMSPDACVRDRFDNGVPRPLLPEHNIF